MHTLPPPESHRVIANLRDLAARTSNERGAQRVAWGPVWREARAWFQETVARETGLPVQVDPAGNAWVTLPGHREESIIFGSHLDSVPSGGWLDGVLGVVAGIEALKRWKENGPPPFTLHLVDWADEEGARYGRSLTGSAASAGSLDPQVELAHLVDRNGVKLPDALAENGVSLETMMEAYGWLKARKPIAYLELHIEQGPVLEAMGKKTGVVLGTMGVERYMFRFTGQAVHAGATPIPLRQDAFLAAADFALKCREVGLVHSGNTPKTRVVATCGVVKVEPGFVTAVPGVTEISLDLRALDAKVLASMWDTAQLAARAAAETNGCQVSWKRIWNIEPRPFDPALLKLCAQAVTEMTGEAPELPSGPLHDAAEMAALMPTVMVFALSSPGISHTRLEDTPEEALDTSIRAFLRLLDLSLQHYAG